MVATPYYMYSLLQRLIIVPTKYPFPLWRATKAYTSQNSLWGQSPNSPRGKHLQHNATRCNTPQHTANHCEETSLTAPEGSISKCPCSGVLQCIAVCDSVLQCVAVCCRCCRTSLTERKHREKASQNVSSGGSAIFWALLPKTRMKGLEI